MLKTLNKNQQVILQKLSNHYLSQEDLTKRSIEIDKITNSTVTFWVYDPNKEGKEITLSWFEFTLHILAPVMFGPQLFKFNGIVGKCLIKPEESREDLILAFEEFHQWYQIKLKRKLADTKNKATVKNKT